VLLPFAAELEEADRLMVERITPAVIEAAVAMLPRAWSADDTPGGALKHHQVYADYLLSRLESRHVFVEEALRARSRHV
jgi:hypothetical protein